MKKNLFVVEKPNNDLFNISQGDNLNISNNRLNNSNINLSNINNFDNSNKYKNKNNNLNGMNNNNKKQIYPKNKETNFLMLDNNIFKNITNTITKINNQILFEHSFINSKTSCYVSFLEEPKIQNTIININSLIENRKGFEEFQISFDWEYYELILILASCKMNNELFEKYNEFIMIYLFNGMSKLNEINFLDNIKMNEKYCFEKLLCEVKKFYEQKGDDFRYNSENNYILEQKIDKKLFFYICFIYYKLEKEKKLDFTEYKYNKYTIQPLLSSLKFKENIIELNLSNNDIGNEGCYCLGNLLRINKNLSVLILSFCKIDNVSLKFLLKGLKYKSIHDKFYLTQLNLSDNNITEEGGEYLGLILVHFNKLQWYNISNNKINNNGAIKLFKAYNYILNNEMISNPNLKIINTNSSEYNLNLNISSNRSNLSLSLMNSNSNNKNLHNLETLILIGIGIYSEQCLTMLGDIVKHPKCGLKALVLSQNNIGKTNPNNNLSIFNNLKDVRYLLQCIKENKTINELLLLSCQIENNIIEDIYQMLKGNKTIEYLVLYNNNINQQMAFIKLLSLFSDIPENNGQTNNYLKVLDLSKNNCPIEINCRFLNIIERLQLSSLDISQNDLSREGSDNFKNLANRIGDKLKIIY
jgi:Ran GTPase-activating protein (RanGAP) involved in mRNA processing and transport